MMENGTRRKEKKKVAQRNPTINGLKKGRRKDTKIIKKKKRGTVRGGTPHNLHVGSLEGKRRKREG